MNEITPVEPVRDDHVRGSEEMKAVVHDVRDDAQLPSNNFAFTPSQLHKLLTHRTLAALDVFGGLRGLAAGLRTDIAAGLSVDETSLDGTVAFDEAVAAGQENRTPELQPVEPPPSRPGRAFPLGEEPDAHFVDRTRIFGANRLPRRKQKSFFRLMWIAFNDKLLILLTISAFISLAIGIYQSVSATETNSNIEWVDGLTVVAAILVIIFASAATDWQKNHKFEKLNQRKQQRDVTVVRSGRAQQVSIYDVMVGDIMHIEAGEVVACDGILIKASGLYIDESSISGETELVHKTVQDDHNTSHAVHADPFIMGGTTVCRGVGRYLIISVGQNSTYGRTLMSLREDVEVTPLQAKLGRLGKQLIMIGGTAGAVYFCILFIRFLVRLNGVDHKGPSQKAEAFLHILILAITVVVITVPEGLALNVTIALAFATKRMLKDNNLVRLIRSVEIMGNATCVCSDKTGTLTLNQMTVVAGRIGIDSKFDDIEVAVGVPGVPGSLTSNTAVVKGDTSRHLISTFSSELKDLIKDSIALNSTAFEKDDTAISEYIGSSTETALLKFARDRFTMRSLREERVNSPIVTMLPFDSSRKWMAVLIKLRNGRYRLLVKGAAEVVFEYCAYTVSDPTYQLTFGRISESDRVDFRNTIHEYANKMLRPVAIAFRDFDEREVFESPDDDPATINLEWLASGMILIGCFGIRDPLRPEVVESVRKCQEAGVFVRMVTGDNFDTAKAIATECGIFTAGGIAMDGPTFRKLSSDQLDSVIPRLQVLARSSPEDKLLLVTRLREMNETVAVTGDGTNDALALKAADVGFAMGIQGTEVAKEAASIILLDDNFASIVKALSWGRTVNDAVKKFCQFQFTINITAGIATVVSELVGDSIFTVVQLLWINLIMDIFASLGLATDKPSPDFLKRKPEPRNAPIVSITMWKMILGQAVYQLLVVFLVHYVGWDLFNPGTDAEIERLQTLVFNIYVWMQFFNQHNCRRVDNKLDIWYQGVLTNPWFIGVQCITIVGQFVIIFKGGEAFDTEPLTGAQWGWSMLFGILTIPLGALIRHVPDVYVERLFEIFGKGIRSATSPFRRCFAKLPFKNRHKLKDNPQDLGAVESLVIRTGRTMLQPMVLHPLNSPLGHDDRSNQIPGERQNSFIEASRSRAQETEKPDTYLDLQGMIEAAKLGRALGNEMLELHPRTLKNDPVLVARSNSKVPPSQDPAIQRYVVRNEVEPERKRVRKTPARTVWVEPTRPSQAALAPKKGGLSLEGFLRSKRR